MRDLLKDLELCTKATSGKWISDCSPWDDQIISIPEDYGYVRTLFTIDAATSDDIELVTQAREGWPHAIERALKAEELIRDILPMVMWESCRYREHAEADPTTHCCDWNEIAERIREVLNDENA